jgi:hypothetical protein
MHVSSLFLNLNPQFALLILKCRFCSPRVGVWGKTRGYVWCLCFVRWWLHCISTMNIEFCATQNQSSGECIILHTWTLYCFVNSLFEVVDLRCPLCSQQQPLLRPTHWVYVVGYETMEDSNSSPCIAETLLCSAVLTLCLFWGVFSWIQELWLQRVLVLGQGMGVSSLWVSRRETRSSFLSMVVHRLSSVIKSELACPWLFIYRLLL